MCERVDDLLENQNIGPSSNILAGGTDSLKIAQVSFAVIYCFLAAGVVFGFAALKPVLIRENVYRHLCTPDELDQDAVVCDGQEIRYASPPPPPGIL